jgi:hypothetical protein
MAKRLAKATESLVETQHALITFREHY